MNNRSQTSSHPDDAQQVAAELSRLFDRQIEMTKWEAFVGLTPEQREEYEKINEQIRESYSQLAKLESGR
jgi:hypothetical protein